jgi:hypothetical protein
MRRKRGAGVVRFGLIGCLVLALVGCGGSDDDGVAEESGFSVEVFADPPAEYRPQTRWWWPGAAVEDDALREQLSSFVEVGYGAVEIQPFMAALTRDDLRQDPRIRAVGDATFRERLHSAACAARDLGMPWDLTFGSGWSTGGVGLDENGERQLLVAELPLTGPTTYTGPLPIAEPPAWIEATNMTLPSIDGFDDALVPVAILAAEVLDDSAGAPVTLGDTKSGDLDAVILENDAPLAISGKRKGTCLAARTAVGNDLGPVVGNAVNGVLSVRPIEAVDDLLDTGRTVDRRGGVGAAAGPTLQHHLSQSVDVIGMKVGQKDRIDVPLGYAHHAERARGSGPAVDDVELVAGDHRHTRAGALRIGQRRTGSAENDVQAIRKTGQQSSVDILRHDPLHQP